LIRARLADLFYCFHVQMVARAFERPGADKDALVDEVLKVARRDAAIKQYESLKPLPPCRTIVG
jgi:hypothetical protein